MFSALAAGLNPLHAQSNKHKRKLERAKNRIERILNRYPELRTTKEVTVVEYDTVYKDKIITEIDTFIIDRVDTVVPLMHFEQDSSRFMAIIENDTFIVDIKTRILQVIQPPKIFYIHDTLRLTDTLVTTIITKEKSTVINTKKDFWFNLGQTIKQWIWWILIVLGIILVIRLAINKALKKLL